MTTKAKETRATYVSKRLLRTILFGMLAFHVFGFWTIVKTDEIQYIADGKLTEPRLVVHELGYKNGQIYQKVDPDHADAMQASWAAAIWLPGSGEEAILNDVEVNAKPICGGHGKSTYFRGDGKASFSPDYWTDDDCSGLIIGAVYEARVSWEWFDSEGLKQGEVRKFEFIHTEAKENN